MPALVVPEREPCPFCEILAGRYAKEPPAIVREDDATFVFLAPAALGGLPGHALVIPRRHVQTIFDCTTEDMAALGDVVARTARAVRAAFDPPGLIVQQHNGEAGFQTVPHVHFHVIPKREPSPFPPTEWIDVTPYGERVEHAARLRAHFD